MQEMDLHVELGQLPWPPARSPQLLDAIVDNHHAVVDAIEARDVARARALTEEHIDARTRWLIDMRLKITAQTDRQKPASSTGSPQEARA
jgi:DNA-binding GntR family transcriptional regulator